MEKRRKRDDGEVDGNINSVQTSEDPLLSALGRDVLTDVLQKLPPESLIFRCKLVSKTWQSLISDPAFVDGYCRMHHHVRSSGFIQQEIDAKRNNKGHPKGEVLQFISFDNDGADAASTVITGRLGSLKNVRESDVLFVDVHKDVLLCIQCKELTLSNILKAQRYFLINPHSKQRVVLPNPPSIRAQNASPRGIAKLVLDEEKQCFKVIRFSSADSSVSPLKVETFSSETWHWESKKLIGNCHLRPWCPAMLGSDLYFMVIFSGQELIFSYNMHNEQLKLLKPPTGHNALHLNCCLWVSGGCLLYVQSSIDQFNVWSMQVEAINGGNKPVWALLHSANLSAMVNGHPEIFSWSLLQRYESDFQQLEREWRPQHRLRFTPITFHPTCQKVVLMVPGMMLLYDLCTRRIIVVEDFTEESRVMIKDSFIIPYEALAWPTLIPAIKWLWFPIRKKVLAAPYKKS